jgi:three-Cys-motif partner protein
MSKARTRHFDLFRPHTHLKHQVLRHYLESWVRIMLLRPGAGDEVILVDAFAGEGMDLRGNHGSPVILADLARIAELQLRARDPGRPFRVRVLAIEQDRKRFAKLQANLTPYGDRAEARLGSLAEFLPAFIAAERETPCMFFIDPFGVKGLEAAIVREILAIPRWELLAQFSDEGALRLCHASVAEDHDIEAQVRRAVKRPSLFTEEDDAIRARVRAKLEVSNAAKQRTRRASEAILVTAYGDYVWEQAFLFEYDAWSRRQALIAAYREMLEASGGVYSTTIPVRAETGEPVYTLLHASRHREGRKTMKEAVEWALNHCELPASAVAEIRKDLCIDLDRLEQHMAARWAGRQAEWSTEVRDYLLRETDVFGSQLAELKRRLQVAARFVPARPGAKARCTFPTRTVIEG